MLLLGCKNNNIIAKYKSIDLGAVTGKRALEHKKSAAKGLAGKRMLRK